MTVPLYLYTLTPEKHAHLLQEITHILKTNALDYTFVTDKVATPIAESPMSIERISTGILICVGGDGTLLDAIKKTMHQNLDIIGVNTGKLGFLSDIPPTGLNQLIEIVQGTSQKDTRHFIRLNAHTTSTQAKPNYFYAVNEISLHRLHSHLIAFSVYSEDTCIASYEADGLLISTPTGSTAYNLSAGGPVVHPKAPVHILNPICPHKLTSRPLILPASTPLQLRIHSPPEHFRVSLDGQDLPSQQPSSHFLIQQSTKTFTLLHPSHYHFYHCLQAKLQWEAPNAR